MSQSSLLLRSGRSLRQGFRAAARVVWPAAIAPLTAGVLLSVSGAVFVLYVLVFGSSDETVSQAIADALRAGELTELRLNEVTEFEWEEFFLFQAYASHAAVCDSLGIDAAEGRNLFSVPNQDLDFLLVFRDGDQFSYIGYHYRGNFNFVQVDFTQPLSPRQAVFSVSRVATSAEGEGFFHLDLAR